MKKFRLFYNKVMFYNYVTTLKIFYTTMMISTVVLLNSMESIGLTIFWTIINI